MICNRCCELVRAAEPWGLQCSSGVAVLSAWQRDDSRQRVKLPAPVVGVMVCNEVSVCMTFAEVTSHCPMESGWQAVIYRGD